MNYKRVAVVRGGQNEEYKVSMQSGAAILETLRELGYSVKDIVITKSGSWLESGMNQTPDQAFQSVDVVFVALDDPTGYLQSVLQKFQIPYTGSNTLSSKISANKILAKESLASSNVLFPKHIKVSADDLPRIEAVVEHLNVQLGEELFIKPVSSGSSIGARYAPNSTTLSKELRSLLSQYDELIVEEFIRGKEASVAILEDFRQQKLYTLPVIEIIPPNGNPFYAHEDKVSDSSYEICPGRFSYHEKAKIEDLARKIHSELNCQNYSKADFVIKDGEVYFLEINSAPSLAKTSSFLASLQSVGLEYKDLIAFLVESAKR